MSAANPVPACVTPERLMAFLKVRNPAVSPRFATIARHYKQHGEAWQVRWDYAFYQMAIETNFLSYRRPDGRQGDVAPVQNNFAGIGATGGGVPGDRFADVGTGVLAQIQHLVAYSGQRIDVPVAPRTQLKQDEIVARSLALGRAVRFSDLAGRWAADRAYDRSIEWVATQYRDAYCTRQAGSAAPYPFAPPMLLAGPEPAARVAAYRQTTPAPAPAAKPPSPKTPVVRTIWRQMGPGDMPPAGGALATKAAPGSVPTPVAAKRRLPAQTATAAGGAVPTVVHQPPDLPPAAGTSPAPTIAALASQAMADEPLPAAVKSWSQIAGSFSMHASATVAAGACRITPPTTLAGATALIATPTAAGTELTLVAATDAAPLLGQHAKGSTIGTFDTAAAAMAAAKEYCPAAREARAGDGLARSR